MSLSATIQHLLRQQAPAGTQPSWQQMVVEDLLQDTPPHLQEPPPIGLGRQLNPNPLNMDPEVLRMLIQYMMMGGLRGGARGAPSAAPGLMGD